MADAKRGKMHASASQLALVLLLIGWKGGANLLSQSHRVESAKPITFRHSNENRSITLQPICCWGYHYLASFITLNHLSRDKCVFSSFCSSNALTRDGEKCYNYTITQMKVSERVRIEHPLTQLPCFHEKRWACAQIPFPVYRVAPSGTSHGFV